MITVKDLTREFDKRGIAGLHRLSFELGKGQVMGILGPNGSGKSTLLNILSGTISPDAGTFSLDGKASLFPGRGSDSDQNVQKFLVGAVTLAVDEEKKIQLSRDLADTFEFTFQLRQNLSELSSGQKQKVLLAKELINNPALLLMDEPFTHLDPFTRKDILRGLFQYIRQQTITVLWVTHDLEEAFQFSDVIGLMNFGKFEQIGAPETVVRNPRSLFVAKFLGYRNFFPMKWVDGAWVTNWGKKDGPQLNSLDGILIVPDVSWEEAEDGLVFLINKRHAGKQSMEYELSHETRTAYFLRGPKEDVLEIGTQIKLKPIWAQCLEISL